MICAEPPKIRAGLHPRADARRIGHARVVLLERGQVDPVLQRKFDHMVVELEAGLLAVIARWRARVAMLIHAVAVAEPLSDPAARRGPALSVVMVEVGVMRIILPRRMWRKVDNVMVGLRLLVRGHLAAGHGAPGVMCEQFRGA